MSKEFRLQDPGEGIHEAEILEIRVAEGEEVKEGDPILAVETDKAAVEIPSPYAGTVESIKVKVGDTARVGEVLMTFRNGEAPAVVPEEPPPATAPRAGPVPAAPSTRRLARELGVDLRAVPASGPGGRVTAEDVRAFAAEAKAERAPKKPAEAVPPPAGAYDQWGAVERLPLVSIRRATAQRTAESWAQIPHVMHQDMADITALERFRRAHKAKVEAQGGKLTLTVLVLKAIVAALKQFPRFNASLDPESREIVLKRYYNIGVAVATDDGLVVPVLKEADRKSVTEIAVELAALTERARQGKLQPQEMHGGTFTITNPGAIGGTVFTPIINFPESAIMGMAHSHLTPVAEGDLDRHRITARLLLPLCLAFDHRLNDGAEAAAFVRTIADLVADPESFLLVV